MSQLILYDIPSKGRCACWSLNPWKTRLVLAFKGLDYKTTWLEYPDIAPTLESFNIPPRTVGPRKYTIPAMSFTDGSYLMDSGEIATRLEKEHPSPSLHLDSPMLPQVEALVLKIREPLNGVWMPRVPLNLLNPRSKEYFERTRGEAMGMPLAQLMEEKGGEEVWNQATPGLKELDALVSAKGGPFAMGDTVSYADFIIVGWLHFFKVIDEERLFTRVVGMAPALGKLYDASRTWLERDDQ